MRRATFFAWIYGVDIRIVCRDLAFHAVVNAFALHLPQEHQALSELMSLEHGDVIYDPTACTYIVNENCSVKSLVPILYVIPIYITSLIDNPIEFYARAPATAF